MRNFIFITLLGMICGPNIISASILEVGPGKTYATPVLAANVAEPGDTILIFPNTYSGGYFISNLHGNENAYIYIIGVNVETVIFQGNSQAFHFSDVSYLQIENISITGQTGNGVNIDDGGSYDTPSHHVNIVSCRFYDMGAQGNNDMLKLSGLDDFLISLCTFRNGATGGSGIDMVGCHSGIISKNHFENMGSNSIQAKGGTQHININANYFENGGQRTLNLGGSTGLQFFRPVNAPFEAADLQVYANVIVGSWSPIAYVGSVRVYVVNNTIINPENWIIRILQETVDPTRLPPCGDNFFVNNIVYYNNSLSRHVNTGPNTAPETFTFMNNLWYNHQAPANSAPQLPVAESNGRSGLDPQFVDFVNKDFSLMMNSPAIDAGTPTMYTMDYSGTLIPQGPAYDIGAFEFEDDTTPTREEKDGSGIKVTPNPFQSSIMIWGLSLENKYITIKDVQGRLVFQKFGGEYFSDTNYSADLSHLSAGIYFLQVGNQHIRIIKTR